MKIDSFVIAAENSVFTWNLVNVSKIQTPNLETS